LSHKSDAALQAVLFDLDDTLLYNHLLRDILPAQPAGMVTYLAEDWVTNPDPEIQPDRRGTLGDLIEWVEDGTH